MISCPGNVEFPCNIAAWTGSPFSLRVPAGADKESARLMPPPVDRFSPETSLPAGDPPDSLLPKKLLYATGSALGGPGLGSTSLQSALGAYRRGFLGRVVCHGNLQKEISSRLVRSLDRHPVRLLSCLPSEEYYGAKKRYADWISGREVRRGGYDFFHGWSGDSFQSLVEARAKGIPSAIEIPTWHRNKGSDKRGETQSEREARLAHQGWQHWREWLPIDRPRMLAEYDLADVVLVQSRMAAESFLAAGMPEERIIYVARGVDPQRYAPGEPPNHFRLIFVGALIKRKGVHHILAAWKKLGLRDAELVLCGTLHGEMKPYFAELATPNVKHLGHIPNVAEELSRSSAFIFPSECEGFAKATVEAAACGLPLITTREGGDMVIDGYNGILVPANDPEALADAIKLAHEKHSDLKQMGLRGRERVEKFLTWDHFRHRLLHAYARAKQISAWRCSI